MPVTALLIISKNWKMDKQAIVQYRKMDKQAIVYSHNGILYID